jgi:hypothetical protein
MSRCKKLDSPVRVVATGLCSCSILLPARPARPPEKVTRRDCALALELLAVLFSLLQFPLFGLDKKQQGKSARETSLGLYRGLAKNLTSAASRRSLAIVLSGAPPGLMGLLCSPAACAASLIFFSSFSLRLRSFASFFSLASRMALLSSSSSPELELELEPLPPFLDGGFTAPHFIPSSCSFKHVSSTARFPTATNSKCK